MKGNNTMKALATRDQKIKYLRAYFTTHGLFTIKSTKTVKGQKYGYRTLILYLKSSTSGGYGNLCPMAGACKVPCLGLTAGMLSWDIAQDAEQRRTDLFFLDRPYFLERATREIVNHVRYCKLRGYKPVVRFNGASDFPFETLGIIQQFPDVQFYDYTKIAKRAFRSLQDPTWPKNYKLCFSFDEKPNSIPDSQRFLSLGGNVAVVFGPDQAGHMPKSYQLPRIFLSVDVVDGDKSDLVFLNPPGTILGLRAKGEARHDTSGFVVRYAN